MRACVVHVVPLAEIKFSLRRPFNFTNKKRIILNGHKYATSLMISTGPWENVVFSTLQVFNVCTLTFSSLWANSADKKLMLFFFFFQEKRIWHIMQIVSKETICMIY